MPEFSAKERLLSAALDLFSQKGYAATSVDEIAEAAGMKGPNIYKYFKNKEELLNSLHNYVDAPYDTIMMLNTSFPIWIHTGSELKQFSMRQINYTIKDDTVIKLRKMCTIEQYRNERFTKQATTHQFDNIVNQFTDIFKGMIENGTIDECDPYILALEYTAPTAMLIQLSDREPSRMEEAIQLIEKHFDFFIEKHCKK